jgi:hypothetical protein
VLAFCLSQGFGNKVVEIQGRRGDRRNPRRRVSPGTGLYYIWKIGYIIRMTRYRRLKLVLGVKGLNVFEKGKKVQ